MERIVVQNLSKIFHIGFDKKGTVMSRLIAIISGRFPQKYFYVLQNITFTVRPGETIGIVGPNGAGKSTLLGIIAGIYKKEGGTLTVHGRVIPVNGLARGLKDRLTTRENIYLIGALFGFSSRSMAEKEFDILHYAELEEYRDTKIHQLSTGMVGRLIFSIAIHCQPDILLLDEVNSHLDRAFNKRVTRTIRELTSHGVSVMVVSHTRWVIEQCDRALLLEDGRLRLEGNGKDIAEHYWGAPTDQEIRFAQEV